ncbi:MAG: phosphatidylserine decarboxylase [Planctomycetaceae bacterium]|nr:phosphatidylserine decarboxylase [Planctomycetaceae bacterium]
MNEIAYFDRYRGEICREKVYGDRALRWTYETIPGRIALAAVVRRAFFSRWYGRKMDRPESRRKIRPFIQEFGLDESEFADSPDDFQSFNEFFYRRLKPEARPIDDNPRTAVFPADGRHLCVPDLSRCGGLFVKGQMFDVGTLLKDEQLTQRFHDGSLLLSRLCPVDYHRFHFPVAGIPGESQLLNGPLYSVNPIALCRNIQILAANKRELTKLETADFGQVLLLEIGATCVGSIRQTYVPVTTVAKGAEKGYFCFGGSSTITLFEKGRITFADDLLQNSAQQRELYARVGDRMGTLS